MASWELRCLICHEMDYDLVAMQEHGMEKHGLTQEDLRSVERIGPIGGHSPELYQWKLTTGQHSGIRWLQAQRSR